jgi:hypothetical protein
MIKINIGDKVKFLNDIGGGLVTKIVEDGTAFVLNDTGFEIPVPINELLPDITKIEYHTELNQKKETKKANVFEDEPFYTNKPDVNFFIAFVPKEPKNIGNSDLDVYLINDSNYFIYYNYAVKKNEYYYSLNGKIEPNVKEKITEIELNTLQENINVVIQLLFYDKKKFNIKEPVSSHIKINSTKFFKAGSFTENDFFDESVHLVSVTEQNMMEEALNKLKNEDVEQIKEQKQLSSKINRPRLFKKNEDKNIKEVDLHIHELVDDEAGMTDKDKLEHQIEVFHKEMNIAIKENYRRIVFIHGVGSGSLKIKIRSELTHKYKHYQFQDASFQEYGYGATMVLLRK